MLKGDRVGLRARVEADVAVLREELYEDVLTYSRASARPWEPLPRTSTGGAYAVGEPSPYSAAFSIVTLDDDELAGSCSLFGIDPHNRSAGLGITLRPGFRGRGLAIDTIKTLCRYGFAHRGLHRLQIETMADNAGMRATASAAGFVLEGTRRQAAWIDGAFLDTVIYGRLAE